VNREKLRVRGDIGISIFQWR